MNPMKIFHFRPWPVSILLILTYTVISAVLLTIHFVPPNDIPSQEKQRRIGINMTDAWHDLQTLTGFGYHPYNSKANDEVRSWLVQRIGQILTRNDVLTCNRPPLACGFKVDFYDDMSTNVTIPGTNGLSVYFQGTNLIVHIHGESKDASPVLVNAHYDSVSTGYGATDDGMAVVSILQLISHFTNPKTPQRARGLVALLNNGEEDYLNGAYAFAGHPISKLPKMFLNLEGAGAGGRATLFRSTDAEVTRFYKSVKHPFGSVMSGDGFKRKLVRSETDYKVFVEEMGLRGLDVAFWQPRSRYHTQEDNVAHTSRESLWHMLGASISALEAMMDYTGDEFTDSEGGSGKGSDAVWFDLFGRWFIVLKLQSAFIITVILLIVPPIIIILTLFALARFNKLYLFSNLLVSSFRDASTRPFVSAFEGWRTTRGWRGFTRYPISVLVSAGIVISSAFLLTKINPFIVYSSLYAVFVFYMTLWIFLNSTIMKGADWWRPTALVRVYAWGWQFLGWWAAMVVVAVMQNKERIGGVYFVPIFYTGAFLAVWISLLEMFFLDPQIVPGDANTNYHGAGTSDIYTPSEGYSETQEDATEDTPLFRGPHRHASLQYSSSLRRPFTGRVGGFSRRSERGGRSDGESHCSRHTEGEEDDRSEVCSDPENVYGDEQCWSNNLPQWTWILEFFLAVPIPLIVTEQLGLFFGTVLAQTGADGNSMLNVHLGVAVFSMLILIPTVPFLHRLKGKVTLAMILLLIGTGIYCLVAFPFSPNSKLKIYFQQNVNLQTGENKVILIGASPFVERIAKDSIPSSLGKKITCEPDTRKTGLTRCWWQGIQPSPVPGVENPSDWVFTNITGDGSAEQSSPIASFGTRITIKPKNSRNCKILFNPQISTFYVHGTQSVTATPPTKELRLWSRNWDEGWTVDVEWDQKEDVLKRKVEVVCMWADVNKPGVIPAFDEVKHFLPTWAAVSKASDGLVEGWV